MSGFRWFRRCSRRGRGWVVGVLGAMTATLAAFVAAVFAVPALSVDGWSALQRPLYMPRFAPGGACPVSRVDPRVDWGRVNIFGGSGIGPGPVYPGLGAAPPALLEARPDEQYGGPWHGRKVFWYMAPSYRGPVLLRGRRLDGTQAVRFNGGRLPAAELRIESYDTVTWHGQPRGSRGVATDVRVQAPGCYGIQIDGTTFSRVVVFRVTFAR